MASGIEAEMRRAVAEAKQGMRGTMMPVQESGEGAVAKAIPLAGNDTDRWNAVAVLVLLLMTPILMALVHLVFRTAGSS